MRRKTRNGSWKNIKSSLHIDRAIGEVYASGKRGAIKDLAIRIDRPYAWVRYRAQKLGISQPRHSQNGYNRPWNDEKELEVLETNAKFSSATIRRKLKKAGYQRTIYAIEQQVRKMELDRMDPDYYRAADLDRLLGLMDSRVAIWVSKGYIRTTKRDNRMRAYAENPRAIWIKREDIKAFIRDYPQKIDLRKVDRLWFIDLCLGAPQGMIQKMAAEHREIA